MILASVRKLSVATDRQTKLSGCAYHTSCLCSLPPTCFFVDPRADLQHEEPTTATSAFKPVLFRREVVTLGQAPVTAPIFHAIYLRSDFLFIIYMNLSGKDMLKIVASLL